MKEWRDYFPLAQVRPEQARALDFITDSILAGNEFTIAELGTGVGKSAIAITVARWVDANAIDLQQRGLISEESSPGGYVLTSQKILQDQYLRDFADIAGDIRSSTNYTCQWAKDHTCAETSRVKKTLRLYIEEEDVSSMLGSMCSDRTCPYKQAKGLFKSSIVGITNYSFFISEVAYTQEISRRALLVLDESHAIEEKIRSWATVTIDNDLCKKSKISVPRRDDDVKVWVRETYQPAVAMHLKRAAMFVKNAITARMPHKKIKTLSHEHEILDKHLCGVNRFVNPQFGIADQDYIVVRETDKQQKQVVQLKPLNIAPMVRDFLYTTCDIKLMMSATVLNADIFSRSAGISKNAKRSFISIPSPFPPENRQIYYVPVGRMSRAHQESSLPALCAATTEILKQHENDKGIIHCQTHKIAEQIEQSVQSPRLITATDRTREQALDHHIQSSAPTVLLSPSMTEGVDLRDDLSRFQVICKIPYPNLADAVTAEKMKRDPQWYAWCTAKALIQSVGRSIRSMSDSAQTYILDEDFQNFFRRNRNVFPTDFCDLIKW